MEPVCLTDSSFFQGGQGYIGKPRNCLFRTQIALPPTSLLVYREITGVLGIAYKNQLLTLVVRLGRSSRAGDFPPDLTCVQ